jgi:large subunit ribosomal protein L9
MKVILTDEIRGLGGRGDVVTVKDGYARNYLIPKSLAREATPGNLKAAEHEKKKWAMLTMQEVEAAKVVADELKEMKLVVYKRAGAEGTLFGSVTTSEIADGLAEKGIEIDKRRIETHHPIKSLGEHEVELHLHREVVATFVVDVHPLGEEQEQQAAPVAAAVEAEPAEVGAETEAAETPAEAEQES